MNSQFLLYISLVLLIKQIVYIYYWIQVPNRFLDPYIMLLLKNINPNKKSPDSF